MSLAEAPPPAPATARVCRGPLLARALRAAWRDGYSAAHFRSDLLAGLIVGAVALPLSMALAIATGVPPQHGLYTAAVAGAVIAIFGGSHVQVSGPTAAFVVILAPIVQQYGIAGLMCASLMAGVILILLGVGGLGKLIEFIPYPVTTGFTAGIAVVIATLQLKDFFGLTVPAMPDHFVEKVAVLIGAAGSWRGADAVVGGVTLAMLVLLPRLTRRVPAPLIALPVAAVAAWLAARIAPGLQVATIDSAFGGIPATLPRPSLPWSEAAAAIEWRVLIGPALAIALLGAIESLLSAVISDGMTGRKHDPDAELIGQGLGNVVAPFFGGFAATGAIARTATNVRAGARTPVAAIIHAAFIFAAMGLLAGLLGYLPMAAMAALLLVVAWNMSELRHAIRVVRIGPRSDAAVLIVCFGLTVIFDMVVAVGAGVVLAALLFMRRMAELSTVRLAGADHPALSAELPTGVLVYEVAGPLFFGAAQRGLSALRTISSNVRAVILDMRGAPTMDTTGLINLESTIETLRRAGIFVAVAGARHQPLRLMANAGWKHRSDVVVFGTVADAVAAVRAHLESRPPIDKPEPA